MTEISQADAREAIRLLRDLAYGAGPTHSAFKWAQRLLAKYPEPKACPFCGGTAIITDKLKANGAGITERRFEVWCTNCAAGVTRCTEKEALAAWDRRA